MGFNVEVDGIVRVLKLKKLEFRKVTQSAYNYMISKWLSQHTNPSSLSPKPCQKAACLLAHFGRKTALD